MRLVGEHPEEGNISYTAPRDEKAAWVMRQRWSKALSIDPNHLAVPHLVHGSDVCVVDLDHRGLGAAPGTRLVGRYDALVTRLPKVPLMTTHADCMALLLYEPNAQIVAAVHAGWRSTVGGVVERTIDVMTTQCGADPHRIVGYVGPTICGTCYEVGDEVVAAWELASAPDPAKAVTRRNGRWHFDLVEANVQMLVRCGVQSQNIQLSEVCTRCNGQHWFSHRGQGARTGRFAAFIMMNE
jgi:YfiH family protein